MASGQNRHLKKMHVTVVKCLRRCAHFTLHWPCGIQAGPQLRRTPFAIRGGTYQSVSEVWIREVLYLKLEGVVSSQSKPQQHWLAQKQSEWYIHSNWDLRWVMFYWPINMRSDLQQPRSYGNLTEWYIYSNKYLQQPSVRSIFMINRHAHPPILLLPTNKHTHTVLMPSSSRPGGSAKLGTSAGCEPVCLYMCVCVCVCVCVCEHGVSVWWECVRYWCTRVVVCAFTCTNGLWSTPRTHLFQLCLSVALHFLLGLVLHQHPPLYCLDPVHRLPNQKSE